MNNENTPISEHPSVAVVRSSDVLACGEQYFCVVDPNSVLVHTTISLTGLGAIDEWLNIERSMNELANLGRSVRREALRCAPSWEQYEAAGYRVRKLRIEILNA